MGYFFYPGNPSPAMWRALLTPGTKSTITWGYPPGMPGFKWESLQSNNSTGRYPLYIAIQYIAMLTSTAYSDQPRELDRKDIRQFCSDKSPPWWRENWRNHRSTAQKMDSWTLSPTSQFVRRSLSLFWSQISVPVNLMASEWCAKVNSVRSVSLCPPPLKAVSRTR